MSMGEVTASQIRITFVGATPSLYEIECSGTRLGTAEYEFRYTKKEVLSLLTELDSKDLTGYIPAYIEAVNSYRSSAISTISNQSSTVDDITLAAKNLQTAITMIEENAFDLLIPEDNINNGSEMIKDVIYSSSAESAEPDVEIVTGVGGKDESDKVYKVIDADSYINLAGSKKIGGAYSLEFEIMLGANDAALYTQMGWYVDVENSAMRYFTTIKISTDGVTLTKTGGNGLTEIFASIDGNPVTEGYVVDGSIKAGEWNRIAIVAEVDKATGYIESYKLYVNGNEHTIVFKEQFKFYSENADGTFTADAAAVNHNIIGIATTRLYYNKKASDVPFYLDNVVIKLTESSAYNPARDEKPTLTVSNTDNWALMGDTLLMLTSSRTVAELRNDLCRNVRVLRNGIALEPHELVQNGDVVVVYTTNGRDYERAYSYYTIGKRVLTFDNVKDGTGTLGVYKDESLYVTSVGGVGGKAENDYSYFINGFNTAGAFIAFDQFITKDVFTAEHNVLVGNSTTIFRYQFSLYDDSNATYFPYIYFKNDSVFLSNSSGSFAGNAGIVESIDGIPFAEYGAGYKIADSLNVDEWYKIAIVTNCDSNGYLDTIKLYINGEEHVIKLVSGIYTPRYLRLVYDQSKDIELYIDNLFTRVEKSFASYSSKQDIPANKDAHLDMLVLKDSGAYLYKNAFKVSEVKAILGDVRVIRNGALLTDSATVAVGDVIVVYSNGGAPFEVAYTYYTVSNYESKYYLSGTDASKYITSNGTSPLTSGVTGVAGKNESDLAYHVSGTTVEGTAYLSLFQNAYSATATNLNHKLSTNLLLGNTDSGIQIRLGVYVSSTDFKEIVFNFKNDGVYLTTSLGSMVTSINGAAYTAGTVKLASPISIGEWHDVGIYLVAGENGYVTSAILSVDGTQYVIEIADGNVHSVRHARIYWNTSLNSDIYLDNVEYSNSASYIYSPAQQSAPSISALSAIGNYNGSMLKISDKNITVGKVKELIGENVRVYRNYHTAPVLLSDSDKLTNGDVIVAYAYNGSEYERAYSYACVMIEKSAFAPLSQNITLHSQFTINVYIPTYVDLTLNKLYLNGVELTESEIAAIMAKTTTVDGTPCYVYSISVYPECAADDYVITMKSGVITTSGEELYYSWTTSIPAQAEAILAGDYTDSAKQLMVDVIEYIKAFYTYVGNEIPAALNVNYGAFAPSATAMADEISTVSEFEGIKAACLNLSSSPRVRFIFERTFCANSVKINGVECPLIEGKNEEGEDVMYVQLGISAYKMTEAIALTIDGVTRHYNLSAYYNGVKGTDAEALVECIYQYSLSAKAYYDEHLKA